MLWKSTPVAVKVIDELRANRCALPSLEFAVLKLKS
uniref:Uncharacterized protein n=1 Tax=Oryza barthii TaxID=65489 RepID=A0A0D3FSD5_9ORYZ